MANYNTGDKAIIVANHTGHGFYTGTEVTITKVDSKGNADYAKDAFGDGYWVDNDDLRRIEPVKPAYDEVEVKFIVRRKDLEQAYEILARASGGYDTYKALQKALGREW
jgi:hypothetical protein